MPNTCDACQQATRNVHSLSAPSDHASRGVLSQDALARTPLWSRMMKPYPSANGHWDPKQADRNDSRRLALSPQNKTHQIPPDKTLPFLGCLTSKPRGNPLQARVAPDEPSQTKEPPIPGPSPSSQPPEDVTTRKPEPEVAPTQSMGEPFGKSPLLFLHSYQVFLTFSSTISSSSRHSLLDNYHCQYARWFPPPSAPKNPNASSPGCKAPLIPTMTLTRNLPTYDRL
ncbi:hypothetical protein O181_070565 [Austropuccinia psidii MF-1]|uniref:Uncharacterized protein n=1 Tax=Austropuccinia psidii MF-1 TaxID=1389203 RepID=A0A9Q3EWQ8_9BASI|nr:hypothetical protein [Austropuccinia psidii MF-1]